MRNTAAMAARIIIVTDTYSGDSGYGKAIMTMSNYGESYLIDENLDLFEPYRIRTLLRKKGNTLSDGLDIVAVFMDIAISKQWKRWKEMG